MIQTMSVLVDSFPKYRQRLANVGRRWHGARFVDDPKYDVRNHVSVQSLPGKAGKKELEEFVSICGRMNQPARLCTQFTPLSAFGDRTDIILHCPGLGSGEATVAICLVGQLQRRSNRRQVRDGDARVRRSMAPPRLPCARG